MSVKPLRSRERRGVSIVPTVERQRGASASMPEIRMNGSRRQRQIEGHDLALFARPAIAGNRGLVWQALWYATNALFFQSSLLSLLPYSFKARILRLFGASVGKGVVIKPRVTIKYPWFLDIADHVWIGEGAWIDNHCEVRLEESVCISQGACLFTGNHDWNDRSFAFFCRPVRIGAGAWIGAFAIIPPGSNVPPGTVIAQGGSLAPSGRT